MRATRQTALSLMLLACAGCDPALMTQLDLVKASDLAGTYTGVLQGVMVSSLDDLEHPERAVSVNLDLLHRLTIREIGPAAVKIESAVIPPLRALVVGSGPVAINAEMLEFENLQIANGDLQFDAVKVKQIVFVQYQGEWIVVLQLVRVGDLAAHLNYVYVYQYISYPSRVAARMTEEQTVRYVNDILRLMSAAQRDH